MRKILFFLVLSGLAIGSIYAKDDFGPNRRLKSGVWLKFGYDAASPNFFHATGSDFDKKTSEFGLDFQFGSTFYIGPRIADKLRFGLDVSWLDFSYFKMDPDYMGYGIQKSNAYFLNFLSVGPIVSFSPVREIAIDAYFRVAPCISYWYYEGPNTYLENTGYNYLGYNTNYIAGLSFRALVFSVGLEYNFAKMKYTYLNDDEYHTDSPNLITNNMRILLGFKF